MQNIAGKTGGKIAVSAAVYLYQTRSKQTRVH